MNYSGQSVPGTPPPMLVQAWHRAGAQAEHAGLSRAVWHGPWGPGAHPVYGDALLGGPEDTAPPHRLFLIPVSTMQL